MKGEQQRVVVGRKLHENRAQKRRRAEIGERRLRFRPGHRKQRLFTLGLGQRAEVLFDQPERQGCGDHLLRLAAPVDERRAQHFVSG